jgi:sugar phosphate isomerase/epimerase
MNANEIGVMVNNLEPDRLRAFAEAGRCRFRIIHTGALAEDWLTGPNREQYVAAARASGLTIATMFVGFDGQSYASIDSISRTVGLVIPELREHRCRVAQRYSDLARELGVASLGLHVGFLPAERRPVVDALRMILDYCAGNGQWLHLETGQEPGQELLGLLQAVDRPNLGINFDPANFVLYGTDEPLEALEILGPYVRGVHCKDGMRPGRKGELGKEVPLGQGEVDYPQLLSKLRKIGYGGALMIEREHGHRVRADIQEARAYLEALQSTV